MIKQYTKKDGSKAYMFVAYLGVDPITGKQKRTTRRGFKTKREASIAEAKLQTEVEENGFCPSRKHRFKEIYDLWIGEHATVVKPSSLRMTKYYAEKHILKVFSHFYIEDITILQCQKQVHDWAKSYESTSHIKIVTQQIFDYAVTLGLLKSNPMRAVKLPKIERSEKKNNYYTKEELQHFLVSADNQSNPKHHTFFRLIAYTGMRKGEALALYWEDIDFINKTVNINKNISLSAEGTPLISTTKTKKSIRRISVDDETLNILDRWKKEQRIQLFKLGIRTKKTEQLIFTNDANQLLYPNHPNQWLDQIIKTNDLKPITVHGFRHTHCTLLLEAGTPIPVVQERLGHSDVKVTLNTYAHVTKNQRDQYAEAFSEYVSG